MSDRSLQIVCIYCSRWSDSLQGKRFTAQRKPLHPVSHVKKPYTSKNPLPVRTGDAVAYRGGSLAQMPDVLVVLGNRAVTAEQAGLGNVDDALLAPATRWAGARSAL